ncbi:hypothetical protein RB195_012585 [Necator americanus]|uniref:PDZ/DHR/GLGF domain protein n=1 Tax=Necator americanus TaxID=51031 RepID=A0ABR1DRN8_NECAM
MSKSVSIPIALSELKRCSLKRLGSHKERKDTTLNGFVISITEAPNGVQVYGTAAERAGLTVGDEILAVNDVEIEGKSHEEVVKYIQECIRSKRIQLKVRRKSIDKTQQSTSTEPKVIEAYLVSVNKDRTKEVTKRLKKKNPLVKTFDMESIASEPAASCQAPSTASQLQLHQTANDRLKLYELDVKARLSQKAQREKENDFLRSSLRQSKKLQALAASKDKPVCIDMPDLNPTGGKTLNGYENQCYDQADITVNGKIESNNNQAMPLKQVIVSVDRITDHLSKVEGREEDSKILHEYFHSEPVQTAIEAIAVHRRRDEEIIEDESSFIINGIAAESPTKPLEPNVHVVSLYKKEDSYLGATVRNEEDRIVVGRVVKGGIVEKTGLLKEGDELLEMNGIDLRGKNVTEVCELLRSISGEVRFVVSSPAVSEKKTAPPSTGVKYMRALFDYDPEDDIYVPCKELALKFQRGDILHVMSTEDENWWQAYREGDDTSQSLAGLIPSSSFHQQVVLYMDEMDRDTKPKCRTDSKKRLQEVIRTLGRKTSKEVQRSADEPANNSFGYHSDLLTYEEVVFHLARTERKRTLVLCGPEGVGCLELRQRLLESDRDRLAGPIPYTTRPPRDGEVDGVHYHFISRQRFLDDAKASKFVEYGEFEKHMYGTAAADIVNVIRRSKTCVLTLKAESLIAVRTAEIMPFILFVAPPSLQTLRRQKECSGQFHVKDDELKGILTQGKNIEQKFGHLFDSIIVNTDFDKSLAEIKSILRRLEIEPQWVPAEWVQ